MGRRRRRAVTALKWIGISVLVMAMLPVVVLLCARGVAYLSNRITSENGVDEGIYLPLGGQEQYLLIRGEDVRNPVIIYLHGGPAGPDTCITYYWQKPLLASYTFINWDQRGCGRTYYRNADADPDNETADFERALADLDELVSYVTGRFGADRVIIMGHSYGTLLGSRYVLEHPERVGAYVGVGQFVSMEGDIYSYEDALAQARAAGKDTAEMEAAYDKLVAGGGSNSDLSDLSDLSGLLELRRHVAPYHSAPNAISSIRELWIGASSPYAGIGDLRWLLMQMFDIDRFFELNAKLFEYLPAADLREVRTDYAVPVFFISGSCDWTTPVKYTRDYCDIVTAPEKRILLLDGCGHYPQLDDPSGFCELLKSALKGIG